MLSLVSIVGYVVGYVASRMTIRFKNGIINKHRRYRFREMGPYQWEEEITATKKKKKSKKKAKKKKNSVLKQT